MNPQSPRRTQAERRRDSERGLLNSAIDLIAAKGVSAVTFVAIGQTSEFSRGLATQRFGSKQKLIEALLARLHESQLSNLVDHRLDELPGLDAVLTYVDACLRNLNDNDEARAYFRLLSSSLAEANSLSDAFRDVHADVEANLKRWVSRGQSEKTIRAELDPGAMGLLIGCLVLGVSMQLLVDPDIDLAPIRETILSTLRTSLAAPPAFHP